MVYKQLRNKISKKQEALKDAVKFGDYEMAAILREQIDELQEELYNHEQMNAED